MSVVPWARRRVVVAPVPPDWERLCRESVRVDVGGRVAPAHRPGVVPVAVMPSH